MATDSPGLHPGRPLTATGDVKQEVISNDPDRASTIEFKDAEISSQGTASENTEVADPEQKSVEPVRTETKTSEPTEENQVSQREQNRVQALANKAAEAERRAAKAEAEAANANSMIQRLVGSQPVQTESWETQLAKQYKSFDPTIGYPTDGREYANFVEARASQRAQQSAQQEMKRDRDQREMADLLEEIPDFQQDAILMAQVAAIKSQNPNISYLKAAKQAQKVLEERTTKEVTNKVVADSRAKDEAYVETTRGASSNRGSDATLPTDINKMTLDQKEAYLKSHGMWNNN